MSKERPSTVEYEQHKIIYHHYYIDDKGERISVEEPIVASYTVVLGTNEWGARPYIVNEMIDKIKFMLLERLEKENDKDI